MPDPAVDPARLQSSGLQRLLAIGLGAFLALAWFGGGATVDVTATDEWLQLLALPVLCAAAYSLLRDPPTGTLARLGLLLCGVLAVLLFGLAAAGAWVNLAQIDADRYALVRDVATLGAAHAPLGSGVGTFVDSFAQGGASSALRSEYVNHAHNEYAQWWFEAGWPGLLAVLAGLALYAAAGWRLLRAPRRDPLAIACWLAVGAVLAHAWVDFPLRTLSLMAMSALLWGFALAAASAVAAPGTVPDAAPQPA